MSAGSQWTRRIDSLLGVSAYEPPVDQYYRGPRIDSPSIEEARRAMGGIIQPIPSTQLRWYLADLEYAQAEADSGNLARAAQLYRAMRRDGVLMGLLNTSTLGLVRLPKRFYGPAAIVDSLRSLNGSRSVFDEMVPPAELAALAADGDTLGVGVGELVPVRGRRYPVLVRLDPEWLQWVWAESRWYYLSRAGRIPIIPGDGRWVLHTPGGRIAPWNWGLWPSLGRAFIMKEHAVSLRGALLAGVANPAKVLESPNGATEQQRRAMFGHVMNWGPNMAVELPVGWQMKLIEMTGRSYDVYQQEIDTCDKTYMIAIAGQILTTEGGAGFSNLEIPRVIRADLIKARAEALAYTVNTQILPGYVFDQFGEAAVDEGTSVAWDVDTPKDQAQTAAMLTSLAGAIAALAPLYPDLNLAELATRFGLPRVGDPSAGDETSRLVPPPQLQLLQGGKPGDASAIEGETASAKASGAQSRIVRRGERWVVQNEEGTKDLGTYETKEEAEKRLRQIEGHKQRG